MALFQWPERPPRTPEAEGDTRVVMSLCLLPHTIGGETRWLGRERIEQEAYWGWCCPPSGPAYKTIKWRDIRWVDGGVTPATPQKPE